MLSDGACFGCCWGEMEGGSKEDGRKKGRKKKRMWEGAFLFELVVGIDLLYE